MNQTQEDIVVRANALAMSGLSVKRQAEALGISPSVLRVLMSRRGLYYTVLVAQWRPDPERAARRGQRRRAREAVA